MRYATVTAALLLAACGQRDSAPGPVANVDVPSQPSPWDLATSALGATLTLAGSGSEPAMRLLCPAGEDRFIVNVAAFEPIGSEERMTFGQGPSVVTLVADPTGDELRGGVTGEGPVPGELVQLLSGQVAANYGAQNSGPHPMPPAELVNGFAAACSGEAPDETDGTAPVQPSGNAGGGSACLTQDGGRVPENAIVAIGTEPFWGARVEGRCVTYSHPEDQEGTRVWTKFSGTAENGRWAGALGGQPFVMVTRPQPGCSDGMSDNRYPIAVTLTVGGEQRTGCAEPRSERERRSPS